MSVPKFFEFFEPFLKVVQDGELHPAKEVRTTIAENMHLSEVDLSEMLPSGKQTVFGNRVNWARTYLDRAGLIETPVRARYRITEEGKKALKSGDKIDLKYLERYKSFVDFHGVTPTEVGGMNEPERDESPAEILDKAYKQINDALASELMTEVMKLSPTEFETLVVKLLLQMGYGSGIDDAGFVTQASNDGGIDGIIKEDQLGFSSIYIQAKQWAPDHTISRPEIQKFAGALQEQKAQKGLFISTASFSDGARKSADAAGIVLVDGKQLTKLMIKFNLGVSVEQTYEVKRIDSDFFNEGF